MNYRHGPEWELATGIVVTVMSIVLLYKLVATFIIPITLIVVICLIIVLIPKFLKSKNEKAEIEEINRSFKEFSTRVDTYSEKLKKEKLDFQENHIVINDIFNSKFLPQIRERGENYFYKNKVGDVSKINNVYEAVVSGNKDYNVSIVLSSGTIKSASCDCPYFNDKKGYCKHIYALLCKIENNLENSDASQNVTADVESIKNEILAEKDKLLDIIQKCSAILERKQTEYNLFELNKYNIFVNYYGEVLDKLENKIKQTNSVKVLVESHSELVKIATLLFNFEKLFMKKDFNTIHNIKEYVQVMDEWSQQQSDEDDFDEDDFDEFSDDGDDEVIANNPRNKGDISALSMLASTINSNKPNKKKKGVHERNLEEEMDFYDLSSEEREAVKSGKYDPINFNQDDELTDDDYYFEDDDINPQ